MLPSLMWFRPHPLLPPHILLGGGGGEADVEVTLRPVIKEPQVKTPSGFGRLKCLGLRRWECCGPLRTRTSFP